MSRRVFVYVLHQDGAVDDGVRELIGAARRADPEGVITGLALGAEPSIEHVCEQALEELAEVWKISHPALSHPDAEIIRHLMVRVLPKGAVVLLTHDHFALDLAPGLSVMLDAAYIPDAVDLKGVQDGELRAVREEYSGQVRTHVACDAGRGAVITLRPGAFPEAKGTGVPGVVVDKTAEALKGGLPSVGRRFLGLVEAEVGEVDITQSDVLVSVGRGIEDRENLDMVFDLAKIMGAEVSCSRPIVDAKWLGKERQVGNSGKTVKPRVYMALGISGAFQHLAGLKGNPFIVAVNKNPKAPIFQVADVGVVADILELIPELEKRVSDMRDG